MPLLKYLATSGLDDATQVMLATVYLEVCRQIDTPSTTPRKLEQLRAEITERLLRLAAAGERDPVILKREALAEAMSKRRGLV